MTVHSTSKTVAAIRKALVPHPTVKAPWQWGVVDSFTTAPPLTCNIYINGTQNLNNPAFLTKNVRYLESFVPYKGAVVLIGHGTGGLTSDRVIIGDLAGQNIPVHGSITEITSVGGTVTITDPSGPVVNVENAGVTQIVAGSNVTISPTDGVGAVTINAAGYKSLTGPGQTATPGDLTQAGGFTVNDAAGDGVTFSSAGAVQVQGTKAGTLGFFDTSAVVQQAYPTTLSDVISGLVLYGIFKPGWDATVAALSPTYWWKMAETTGSTATDSADTNPGTYTGGITLNQPSIIPSSIDPCPSFDGSTGYMQATGTPINASLPFSYVIGFKSTATVGPLYGLCGMASTTSYTEWSILIGGAGVAVFGTDDGSAVYRSVASSANNLDGNPHLLGFTWSPSGTGGTLTGYQDGVSVGSYAFTGLTTPGGPLATCGWSSLGSSAIVRYCPPGELQSFVLWQSLLGPTDMATLYSVFSS